MTQQPPDILSRLPTWREMNMDTDPQAEAIQFKIWREMSFWRKIEILDELIGNGRAMILAGLRMRHPDATPEQLQRLLLDELLGSDLAATVYGPIEDTGQSL